MLPPWEEFPTYERYTIGWRMGTGEDYLYDWHTFIESLPKDYETRLNYLKSHRPAPLNWGDYVFGVLYPEIESEQKYGCTQAETLKLLDLGLIDRDAAYHTWLKQQDDITLPWLWIVSETPAEAARYNTREFWFFSRQLADLRKRGDFQIEHVPIEWQGVEL